MTAAGTAPLSGVLLAGGRGTRMGRDKATLEFEGRTLAERVAAVLSDACDEVLVASGDGRRLGWLGLTEVADARPDAGPLGGMVAGLESARHPLVAVVAVDMPFASSAVLRLLAAGWRGEDAVIPRSRHGLEPLHAVYVRNAAAALRRRLESDDRSVAGALGDLTVRVVEADEWRPADPAGRFAHNLNRPDDLSPRPAAG